MSWKAVLVVDRAGECKQGRAIGKKKGGNGLRLNIVSQIL
jgi:hypothetical protein